MNDNEKSSQKSKRRSSKAGREKQILTFQN
jgi:hypothetical protein